MPVFEIERDGKVYEVDAPDMNAAASAFDAPSQRTVPQELGRAGLLTGRALADTVAALPLAVMDAGVGVRNLVMGSDYESPSAMYSRGLDQLLPKPETLPEKISSFGVSALAGAKIPVPQIKAPAPAGFANGPAEVLAQAGIPTTMAQRGSRVMQSMARAADTVLGESRFAGKQREALNAALVKDAGGDARAIGPDVLADLRKQNNALYNDLHARVPTPVDDALKTQLSGLKDLINDEVGTPAALLKKIKRIEGPAVGPSVLSGRAAQDIRSSLGRMSRNPDGSVRHFAGQIRSALDDAFKRHASPEDAALMDRARDQFAQIDVLKKSADPFGNASPKKLYTQMQNPMHARSGYGELATAARQVIPDHLANSGTATRGVDVAKIVGLLQNPAELAKVLAMVGGGRLINESQTLARPMPPQVGASLATALGLLGIDPYQEKN